MIKILFLLILIGHSCLQIFSQQDENLSKILKTITAYSEETEPQKIYIHFDKDQYYAGENIWFKIYLLNAMSHLPDTSSSNLWVELVNNQGEVIDTRLFKPQNGFAWGDFKLSDSLSDGNYFVRAYTNLMLNLSSSFHFVRYLYIRNPAYENMISRDKIRQNIRFNRQLERKGEQINLSFFPEGGNLVAGLENRIAFKASDNLGRAIDVSGFLVDSRGQTIIADIRSEFAGIGYFNLNPLPGESYKFVLDNRRTRKVEFAFPKPEPQGYVLKIAPRSDSIQLSIQSNLFPGHPMYSEKLFVVAHTRGVINYGEEIEFREGAIQKILSNRLFPSGITHFTVFLPDHRPVAERLVMIDHRDQLIFSTNILEDEGKPNLLTVLFNAINQESGPIEGSFSISVQTGREEFMSQPDNIISYLMMSSDLVGIIENPADFFGLNENIHAKLDLIMLTHGWRRFAWEKVFSGQLAGSEFTDSYGMNVAGVIINPANNKPVRDHPVQLRVLSGHNHIYNQNTNSEGVFAFPDLHYNDIVRIEITAGRLPGGILPFVRIFSKDRTGIDYIKNFYTEPQQITEAGKNWKRPSRRASRIDEGEPSSPASSIYGTPDQIVYLDERLLNYRSLVEVLQERVTGFSIVQGQMRLRGTSSFYGSSEPVFYVDGVQTDARSFAGINPKEVHRIEVFKGASAAIFGVRGANGAILAYTKRYANIGNREFYDYLILGYHTPRIFYNNLLPVVKNSSLLNPIQTVYWEPNLMTDKNGKARYYIPVIKDYKNYKVIIQGVGLNGGIGFGEYIIKIEE